MFTHDGRIVTKFLLTQAALLSYARREVKQNQLSISHLFDAAKQTQVLLHPVLRTQDGDIEIKLLLNSAWDEASRQKSRSEPDRDFRMGFHNSVGYFKILVTRWTSGSGWTTRRQSGGCAPHSTERRKSIGLPVGLEPYVEVWGVAQRRRCLRGMTRKRQVIMRKGKSTIRAAHRHRKHSTFHQIVHHKNTSEQNAESTLDCDGGLINPSQMQWLETARFKTFQAWTAHSPQHSAH